MGLESTFGVQKNPEVLVGPVDGHDVHYTKRESVVPSDLSVNLDETFLIVGDLSALVSGHGVLESLLEEDAPAWEEAPAAVFAVFAFFAAVFFFVSLAFPALPSPVRESSVLASTTELFT